MLISRTHPRCAFSALCQRFISFYPVRPVAQFRAPVTPCYRQGYLRATLRTRLTGLLMACSGSNARARTTAPAHLFLSEPQLPATLSAVRHIAASQLAHTSRQACSYAQQPPIVPPATAPANPSPVVAYPTSPTPQPEKIKTDTSRQILD